MSEAEDYICDKCHMFICECISAESINSSDNLINALNNTSDISGPSPEGCQSCDNPTTNLTLYNTIMMCSECLERELALEAENQANAETRVTDARLQATGNLNKIVTDKQIVEDEITELEETPADTTIKIRTDIFNAKIVSIIDMKVEIDADNTIIGRDKHFELAKRLIERFKHLKNVLFDLDDKRVNITSEQRTIQQYMNDHINKLRKDEREKIQLKDINYQPVAPKKTPKPKIKKTKFDKKEITRLSKETGVPEYTLQMMCVQMNKSPMEVAVILKEAQSDE